MSSDTNTGCHHHEHSQHESGVKKYTVLRMRVSGPKNSMVKCYGIHHVRGHALHHASLWKMEEGSSVIGDWQIPYTGIQNLCFLRMTPNFEAFELV